MDKTGWYREAYALAPDRGGSFLFTADRMEKEVVVWNLTLLI
jgi:hypothetical protein